MRSRILGAILAVVLVSACSIFNVGFGQPAPGTGTLAPAASATPPPGYNPFPTFKVPAATATLGTGNTPTPHVNTAVPPTAISTTGNYVDDRSTASQVIISYYNAVSRQEYLRAYNYWVNPSDSLGSFTSFANGYKDTGSVDLVFGQITGDAGAGQMYYTVPVIVKATAKNGTRANWSACYVVHLSQPGFFSEPPFDPMGIARGSAQPSDLNANDAAVLTTACSGYPAGSVEIPASGTTLSIDKNNYLDNRSGPIETISSLLNALNSKEYVRAYYYYQNPASFPGPYDSYAAGYSDTDVITVVFGAVRSEGAAGSLYYKTPLGMKVLTTSAATQTFVGCYTLRLAQPSVQATPPFQPMGITAGKFKQVANGTDVNPLLPTACN